MHDTRLVETAARLSQALTPGDLDHTLARITAAAVEVLPEVTYASISVQHAEGELETVAPTAELICDVDEAQYALKEGPCYHAATDTVHVIAPDLATDSRFPRYAQKALSVGIRSQAGIRLFDTPSSQGALNLYSADAGAFEDWESVAALFAHQATTAISYAREIQNLEQAMKTRQTIGQAVGLVMGRYELNEQRAFAFLARLSQQRNIKLREVAGALVQAAEDRAI